MITRMLTLLLAVMPVVASLNAGILDSWGKKTREQPPIIGVLIAYDRPGVVLEVKGKYRLYDPKDLSFISTRFIGKRKFIQAVNDGLKWGEEFPDLHQLLIVPDHQNITTIADGIEYRGSMYIYDVQGALGIVNEVDIEDYIRSILAAQPSTLPEEVLAAIAIAARTNAYYYAYNPKTPFWAVDGTQEAYRGFAVTNPSSPIEKAITATRYLIMSKNKDASNPAPFAAQFSSAGTAGSKINLDQAVEMAKRGEHAARILEQAYPSTNILLMHYTQAG
ncbi:MAG: SpoIID/LytB domain-containing protein [Parachlamydiaceae bacterium]|nr:SpoIID/LytB domain-containing protein [Parachlamydiaceae bacterium]